MLRKSERLTERDSKGNARPAWKDKSIPCRQIHLLEALWCVEGDCTNEECDFRRIIDKLAAYEDSRLKPEEVIAMQEKEKRRRKENKNQRVATV